MGNIRKRATGVAVAAVVAVSLAGCGGGSTNDKDNTSGPAKAGGTLKFLQYSPSEHLDPQRMYIGRDLSNFGRTVYRSLVTFPTSTNPDEANTPVPDLATDTGTPNSDSSEWKFTIKDGVKWQDGKQITCEDFKYGMSRSFATDVITGGPNYILSFLDVPKDAKTGLPAYDGPYKKDHQADFDKAVTCDGNTITYRFNKPFPDFPLAIASLRAFDPYRADQDKGDKSNLAIFSNGPYMLKGTWDLNKGGVLVRNPEWDKSTDDIRQANPDEIDFEIGDTPETINDRLIADNGDDANAITTNSIPPSYYSQIEGPIKDRSVNIESPFVNYVLPNFNRMNEPQGSRGARGRDRPQGVLGCHRWLERLDAGPVDGQPDAARLPAEPVLPGRRRWRRGHGQEAARRSPARSCRTRSSTPTRVVPPRRTRRLPL